MHAPLNANWAIFQQIFSPLIRYDTNSKSQPDLAIKGGRTKLSTREPAQYRYVTFSHTMQSADHSSGRANMVPDGMFHIDVAWYPTKDGFRAHLRPATSAAGRKASVTWRTSWT